MWFARVNKGDLVDVFYDGVAWLSSRLSLSLVRTQSGMVRRYALGVTMGAVVAVGLVLVL